MMARTDDDLAFLRATLDHLQQECNQFDNDAFSRSDPKAELDQPSATSVDEGTLVDEERCERLAVALGFDGNLFRNLSNRGVEQRSRIQQKRVATLRRIISKLESLHSFARKDIDLTSDHVQILRFLARQKVLTKQLEIEIAVQRCRKTVGKRLHELRCYGLVARPRGQRTGETITEAGRQILGEL